MTLRRVGAWALVVLGTAGCNAPERPSAQAPGSRDSAGILITESDAPVWGAGKGWTLGEAPTLELAAPAAAPMRAPMEALRLSDGRFIVADGQPPSVRFFGADGRWLYDVGTEADGRAKLESIYELAVGKGDTVMAYDLATRHALFYDPNGAFVTAVEAKPELAPAGVNGFMPKGLAPDGRVLLQRSETPFPFPGAAWSILPDSTTLYWQGRSGALEDSSGRLLAGESFGFEVQTGKTTTVLAPLSRPLGADARVAAGMDLVWVATGSGWELRGMDPHGKVVRIIRLDRAAQLVTPALRDTFIARYRVRRANAGVVQRQFAAAMDRAPFPDTLPAFMSLFVGRDSTLWLQHAGLLEGLPGDGMLDWTVIGADGRWLGDITMPAGFRPTDAGHGWLLGLWSDRASPTRVRLYPLVEH